MSQIAEPALQRRDLAERLTAELRRFDCVAAVVVFGSAARGDAREESDLDLLVVAERRADLEVARQICRRVRFPKVSLVSHTWRSFERLKREDWLFVKHLADEGLPLWDPGDELPRRSKVTYPGDHAVIDEIGMHAWGLDRLTDIDRYGNDLLFPLASLYGLTKRIAMLANSRAGLSIFQRDRALSTCAEVFPRAAPHLTAIAPLAPFYAQTRGIRSAQTPFPSEGAHAQLLGSAAALRRVVDAVCVG